jgi:hypothetical protein
MEGRIETNGNQEKGKEEKEALSKSVRSQEKGGRRKRPLSFCTEVFLRSSWVNPVA